VFLHEREEAFAELGDPGRFGEIHDGDLGMRVGTNSVFLSRRIGGVSEIFPRV